MRRGKTMKNRAIAILLTSSLLLSSCGTDTDPRGSIRNDDGNEPGVVNPTEAPTATVAPEQPEPTAVPTDGATTKGRPMLLNGEFNSYYDTQLVPSVPAYNVDADFSNVVYEDAFRYYFLRDDGSLTPVAEHLAQDNFVVIANSGYGEFFDVYEDNRYSKFPNFITVDSLMHTYHLYFASLMRRTEKDYLAPKLRLLSLQMADIADEQYNALKGTDWETAAENNLIFFYVGAKLHDNTASMGKDYAQIEQKAMVEYDRVCYAEDIEVSAINGEMEDYTQYKVRGYYEGDEDLERYFRAMMWYGRTAFLADKEDQVKSAVLQCIATAQNGEEDWKSIYDITSFFAGASDDPGYYELKQIIEDAYGEMPDVETAISNTQAFEKVMQTLQSYEAPQINSIPVEDGEDPVKISYRFMGQRFTIDAAIMQKLIYSAVGENAHGEYRMLPDALDTAVVLGSDEAYQILSGKEDLSYEHFAENLEKLTGHFDNEDPGLWNASLYAGWLNTLRPLLSEKGEGYPSYMQSENWVRKDLETFAGSYAELKHDTILYAKQVIAEMGGGDIDEYDDRGYVDPEIEVYNRFVNLAVKTSEGMKGYGMLSDADAENLERLKDIALQLVAISEKELKNESLTDEEYEFIRNYGGDLEHFWKDANQDTVDYNLSYSYQSPCPVIADIATDPNGSVLEVGSGEAQKMFVVFPIDGELHVGSGSAYSFYQFEQPMSDRLTDSEWRAIMDGGYLDDDWNWIPNDEKIEQPAWTGTYRIE